MNEVFAVSPKACASELELRYLLSGFGPALGRYIGRFPARWEALVHEALATFTPIEQARARESLRRAKASLISESRAYDSSRTWLENVLEAQSAKAPFDDVVCERGSDTAFKTLDTLDWTAAPAATGCRVPATAADYARACALLVRSCTRVVLVDPYFKAHLQSRVRPIEALRRAAEGGRCSRVDVLARASAVVDAGTSIEDIVRAARARFSQGSKAPVFLHLVEDEESPHQMHMRYLITEHASMRFDRGFEEFRRRLYVDLSLVDSAMHGQLLALFYDDGHDFRKLTPKDGVQLC